MRKPRKSEGGSTVIDQHELVGSWRLVSIRTTLSDTGETIDLFGTDPLGYGIFTFDGRWMVMVTSVSRTASDTEGQTDNSGRFGAYSGRYFLAGNKVTVRVDVASRPESMGQEQVRFAVLNGDILTLTTPEQELEWAGGSKGVGTAVWERERR
jgi:hypothetical protein